jgi:hypothetical protein
MNPWLLLLWVAVIGLSLTLAAVFLAVIIAVIRTAFTKNNTKEKLS